MLDPAESIIFVPGAYTPTILSAVAAPRCDRERIVSQNNATDSTNISKVYKLDRGHAVRVSLYPSLALRFHTRSIHLEVTHEWACSIASTSSPLTTPEVGPTAPKLLLVEVEWMDSRESKEAYDAVQIYDLNTPWSTEVVLGDILRSKAGLILRNRQDIIVLRVVSN